MLPLTPQKLAVKYSPPRICLIYEANSESFFHEFLISQDDLKLATPQLYKKMNLLNPGYLEKVDPEQIYSLIELMKKNAQKKSKAQRLRGNIESYRQESEFSPNKKTLSGNSVDDIDLDL
jgi:hypothetical protein